MNGVITRIDATDNVALITVNNIAGKRDNISAILSMIAQNGINVDMISLSPPYRSGMSLSFTILSDDISSAIAAVGLLKDKIPKINCDINANNSKITVAGDKMTDAVGIASDVLKTVIENGVEIKLITTSEDEISILVNDSDVDTAYKILKDKYLAAK